MGELKEDWEEASFRCPECGEALSYKLVKVKNRTINIAFFCEGAGDDVFSFEIATRAQVRQVPACL
jgi:predicted RNA-binding Zn-ribbon protein involved in translation (DUF1610 family)